MMSSPFPFPQMAIVAREKLSGFGDHWGVLQVDGSVFDITQDKGMRVVPFREFAAGKPARVIQVIPYENTHAANSRIYQEISNPKPYHLLENNCEILANRVAGNAPMSPQVAFWTVALLVGGVLFLAKS